MPTPQTTLTAEAAYARVTALLAAWEAEPALLNATMALGFSLETARRGLQAELAAWRSEAAFTAIWHQELEGCDPARIPETVLIVAARTVPASTMRQLLWARALDATVLLKPASGQRAVGAALCADDARCVLLDDAPERREETIAAGLARAGVVVVLGSDDTVTAIRAQTPEHKAFIAYGHRISAALLAEDEDDAALRALADDCVAWAHSGCLAPRLALVAGDPERLAQRLSPHLAAASSHLNAPAIAETHARQMATTTALMRGYPRTLAGGFTICVEPASVLAPTYPRRWLALRPYREADLSELAGTLSTLGVGPLAPTPPALSPGNRVTPLGEMQRPSLHWRQDGLRPIVSLLAPSVGRDISN